MAYFKKYNGYYVKDAEAIKHVNISGNTVTTKDADGNTVDQFNLPGGGFPSATYMSYINPTIIKAYQKHMTDSLNTSGDPGLVLGNEVIGYADITFENDEFTLGDLHIQTIHSWQTFSKDGNVQFNSQLGYENNYCRQIRPNRYRALVNVGKYNKNITITPDVTTRVMTVYNDSGSFTGTCTVKDPSGKTIGSAIVVGVKPCLDTSYQNTGVDLYLAEQGRILAYLNSTTDRLLQNILVEVEIMLYDFDVENFLAAPVNTPFIESANGYVAHIDSTFKEDSYVTTNVVVKNRGNVSGYYIDEYKLIYDSDRHAWRWNLTSSQEIPTDLTSGTFYNTTFTFNTYLYRDGDDDARYGMEAVAYMVGLGQGSPAAVSRSDAIPIGGFNYWE